MEIPEFIRIIIDRLNSSGHQAYVVGGAVRDMCLHRANNDWDVATDASSEEIKAIFQDTRNFSLNHDTVILVHAGSHRQ